MRIEHGDMREVLGKMVAEGKTVQSVVTDPPYHLTNRTPDVKWCAACHRVLGGSDGKPAACPKCGGALEYQRSAGQRGFMGKMWDGGDIAFQPGTWRLCWELLPPGGHLVAFAGTRTYHRMAVAIEEAGFEIRDTIAWLYGSGFPKSHNVAVAIDKANGIAPRSKAFNMKGRGERADELDGNGREFPPPYEPATDAARQWDGWGTALKPAMELICLARKPLVGTVAGNVQKYGTGAINIDGCRVWAADTNKADTGCSLGMKEGDASSNSSTSNSGKTATDQSPPDTNSTTETSTRKTTASTTSNSSHTPNTQTSTSENTSAKPKTSPLDASKRESAESDAGSILNGSNGSEHEGERSITASTPKGRWPSNLVHDGSDEVVSAFAAYGDRPSCGEKGRSSARSEGMFGQRQQGPIYEGTGSAARFFFSAKADAGDRLGSKHPTVKPVDLMRWLVRLITPPGGTVLDPFAGSGTTGMACMAEGIDCILVEREAEYVADIKRRLAHVRGDDTPLFRETSQEVLL